MYFINQIGKNDCAFTCLSMLLAHYHHDKNYLFLKHEDRPYNFNELIEEGKKYQTELVGIKVSNEEILKCKKFPLIVTLKGVGNTRHAVLLTRISRRSVFIIDPNGGKRRIPYELFISKWTNHALIVKHFNKMKCPIIPPSFIAKKDKITLPIFQLLSGVSILIGTYFIDQKNMLFIPAIFLSLFIIFELLFRNNLLKAMRRIDENITNYSLNLKQEEYYEFYCNEEKYRYVALSTIPNMLYAFVIAIFIVFILLLNNIWNAFYVILAIMLGVVEIYYNQYYFKSKELEISSKEELIKTSENMYEFQHFSNATREAAYQLGSNKTLFSYLEIAIILSLSVLLMSLTNSFSITYLIFNLFIVYFLKGQIYQIMNYENSINTYNSSKLKIINKIIDDELK